MKQTKAKTMMNACYKCEHRRDLAGDAHSRCAHPAVGDTEHGLGAILGILASARKAPMPAPKTAINVKGNPYGIMSGWFNWPYNFDPVWLESCDGFTPKDVPVSET